MSETRTCHECRRSLSSDCFDLIQAHGSNVLDNVCRECRSAIGVRAWDSVVRNVDDNLEEYPDELSEIW